MENWKLFNEKRCPRLASPKTKCIMYVQWHAWKFSQFGWKLRNWCDRICAAVFENCRDGNFSNQVKIVHKRPRIEIDACKIGHFYWDSLERRTRHSREMWDQYMCDLHLNTPTSDDSLIYLHSNAHTKTMSTRKPIIPTMKWKKKKTELKMRTKEWEEKSTNATKQINKYVVILMLQHIK